MILEEIILNYNNSSVMLSDAENTERLKNEALLVTSHIKLHILWIVRSRWNTSIYKYTINLNLYIKSI